MISAQVDGNVARILIDRPVARNALNAAGWRGLVKAIAEVAASNARVLLVQSSVPGSFCSGSDLAEIAALRDDIEERAVFRAMMREAMDPLRTLPIATIAVVDGDCFGAGVALALACDIRVAGSSARFAITPAKLGISYPPEDVERLMAAVGRGQSARLLFGAGIIDAAEASRIGLVEQLSADPASDAEALARAIAANAPHSISALKAMLNSGQGADVQRFNEIFDSLFGGAAFQEGVAAFRERRPPRFE